MDFDAALSVALDVVSDEERSPALKLPAPEAMGAVSRAGIEGGRPDERNPWLGRSAAALSTTGGLAFSGKLFGEDSGLGFSGLVFSVLLLCAAVDPVFGSADDSLV